RPPAMASASRCSWDGTAPSGRSSPCICVSREACGGRGGRLSPAALGLAAWGWWFGLGGSGLAAWGLRVLAGAPPGSPAGDLAAHYGGTTARAGAAFLTERDDRQGVHSAVGHRRFNGTADCAQQAFDVGRSQLADRAGRIDLCLPERLVS